MADEPTFKEAIEELEKITASLESGELELEKSLALFERGVELIKYCQDKLDGAQAKVEMLLDSLEGQVEVASDDDEVDDS
ncbi:MAG TPA: exodeoxyribonuclease VII small subunit [Candidatus Anoxymicrobiaceae bacterium]